MESRNWPRWRQGAASGWSAQPAIIARVLRNGRSRKAPQRKQCEKPLASDKE